MGRSLRMWRWRRSLAAMVAAITVATACEGNGVTNREPDGPIGEYPGEGSPGEGNPGEGSPGEGDPGEGDPGGGALTAEVEMRSPDEYGGAAHEFAPAEVVIALNGSVTWTNASPFVHNVTFSGPGAPANVPNLPSGTASRTFLTEGTFAYSCTNHVGMQGTVTVTP